MVDATPARLAADKCHPATLRHGASQLRYITGVTVIIGANREGRTGACEVWLVEPRVLIAYGLIVLLLVAAALLIVRERARRKEKRKLWRRRQ
ncbi:MAG TPA: hypothetical protein VNR60_13195 [Croceibacterium sp.]|nr:hypothetical protein [Croceibacterium sp.]